MNTVLFLLPAAAGGYWLLSTSAVTRYYLARLSGYHLLFASTLCGVVLYGLAYGLLLAFSACYPEPVDAWAKGSPELLTNTVQVTLFLAALLPYPLNRIFPRDLWATRTASASGDLIELVLEDATTRHSLVEVSLRSRKSYVGLPLDSGIGKASDSDVSLIPVYSGYRDEATLELKLTRDYRPVLVEFIFPDTPSLKPEDFRVIFPMSEVVSVRLFDNKAFDVFQKKDSENTEQSAPFLAARSGMPSDQSRPL